MVTFVATYRSTVLEGLTLTQYDDQNWVATYAPFGNLEGHDRSDTALAVKDLILKADKVLSGLRWRKSYFLLTAEENATLAVMDPAYAELRALYEKAVDAYGEALEASEMGAEYDEVEWFEDVMGLRKKTNDAT